MQEGPARHVQVLDDGDPVPARAGGAAHHHAAGPRQDPQGHQRGQPRRARPPHRLHPQSAVPQLAAAAGNEQLVTAVHIW